MEEPTDDLAPRIRAGESSALVEFIERRKPQLLAFIERNASDALRRKVEASDILQEVSLNAVHSLKEMELGDRDPFSWLCQLAERRIIDAHRRYIAAQKRAAGREVSPGGSEEGKRGGFIDMLVASMTSPSGAFSRDQREIRLLEALKGLPADAQTALRLRYIEGLPSKEIAQRIGKTDGATRVLLTRSLSKLQDLLRQESEFFSFIAERPREPDQRDQA